MDVEVGLHYVPCRNRCGVEVRAPRTICYPCGVAAYRRKQLGLGIEARFALFAARVAWEGARICSYCTGNPSRCKYCYQDFRYEVRKALALQQTIRSRFVTSQPVPPLSVDVTIAVAPERDAR